MQKLCGYLNFLSKAIVPGRVFTRRLYNIVEKTELKPHHHFKLTGEHKLDLELWLQVLNSQHIYNRKFFDFQDYKTFQTTSFCTDASKNCQLGCGGICNEERFIMQWDEDFIKNENPSINYLELYALCVGVFSWLQKFQNCNIVIFCDNQSVMYMVNNTTSSCPNCMVLLRMLVLRCLINNVRLQVNYIKIKGQHLRGCPL